MPKFVGVDPSLTSSGVVTYDTQSEERRVASFSSSPDKGTVESRYLRVNTLAAKISAFASEGGKPVLVGIEGPAYSSNTGKVWDRAGLWWAVVQEFLSMGIMVVEVPPTSRAKYSTGKGNAGKDEVLLAASRQYPDFDIKDNNQADALIICAAVARLHGHPFDGDLPKNKLEAIDKLKKDLKWEQQ